MSGSVQKSRQVVYTRFFYKQHFYKQRQAEIGQVKLKLSSTLSPWAWTFAIWIFFFHFVYPRYHHEVENEH